LFSTSGADRNNAAVYNAIFGTSAGGNWFDISGCGLDEVNFLRLNAVNCTDAGVRLDAVFASRASAVPVPEPVSLGLLLAGGVGALIRRRHRAAT
jgi:hypothetical protein